MEELRRMTDAELEEHRKRVLDEKEARMLAARQAARDEAELSKMVDQIRDFLRGYLSRGGDAQWLHDTLDEELAALGEVPPATDAGTGAGAGDGTGTGDGDGTGDQDPTTPGTGGGGGTGGGTGTVV